MQTNLSHRVSVHALALADSNVFAGTDSGVYFSSDRGLNWLNRGLTGRTVEALVVVPKGMGGLTVFGGTNGYGVVRSTDIGATWEFVNSGLYSNYILSLAVSDTNLLCGTTDGVFLSTNGGAGWLSTGLRDIFVDAFAVSGSYLIAGTYGSRTFLSTDNGANWRADSTGLTDPFVRALVVFPNGTDSTYLFAGTDGGIFLSADKGTRWAKSGFTKAYVYSLAVADTRIFAGAYYSGAFLSADKGTSWMDVNKGLGNFTVRALAISGTNLIAGTDAGVWRRPLSELVTSVQPNNSADGPEEYVLQQNYPNPFNPNTTIKFELPKASRVTLSVYDMLGREVSVLVGDRMEIGVHQVRFDGSHLASGVYFYRLQAGDFVSTKRLLILR